MKNNHLAIAAVVLILSAGAAYILTTGNGSAPETTNATPVSAAPEAPEAAPLQPAAPAPAPASVPAPQGIPEIAGCTQYTLKAGGWVCSSSAAVSP